MNKLKVEIIGTLIILVIIAIYTYLYFNPVEVLTHGF